MERRASSEVSPRTLRNGASTRSFLDVSWSAIAKLIAALALVWLWLRLWPMLMVVLVAMILAVALDPLVVGLCRRGLSRSMASLVLAAASLAVAAAFLFFTWASLQSQLRLVLGHAGQFQQAIATRLPGLSQYVERQWSGGGESTSAASAAARALQALTRATVVIVLGYILTLYLLVEGKRTYRWVRAFVPERHRRKFDQSAADARPVIAGFVFGNVVTSIVAALVVLVSMLLLRVPAALLLALIAGLFDFVPVLGFIVSAVPAVLLGLTVSPFTAVGVALVFVAYHAVENYLIAPRVYGDQLRLSNVAVLLAFAAGGELGGVVGAVIALPIAAIYPCIERVWLNAMAPDTVEAHRRLESAGG